MALRSSVTARLCLPSSPSAPSSSLSPPSSASKATFLRPPLRPISASLPITSTAISLLALSTTPHEAKAFTLSKEQIFSSVTEVERTIDQVQEVGSSVLETTERILGFLRDALKPGIDVALPIAKQAGEQALKVASPAISEASKKAQEAIESTGIDTKPVLSAAKTVADAAQQTGTVIEKAKPIASSTFETISTTDPFVIVGTAGAAFFVYLLVPSIWSAVSYSLRGYNGELSPAQTLDLISSKDHLLIDIRSEKDKEKAGIPRLPSSAKNKMIAVPLEELPSKLRGLVRSVKKVEAELAALKISHLKKVNKGSNIVIMDMYSDSAKMVARTLTNLGFKNCWIVVDGFSGSRGWLQSRLGADSYNVSFAEVISPSRIIPAAAKRFGTTNTKLLPGAD